ncbi:MAG: MerR family transcriptional regulator [Verrucomicrobiota bacterium]|nr:MerR family transcriptional regulator [Verrucomicrobiota bacterium]
MSEARHPIKVVARRTGLSHHVIRVWEKRYTAVNPQRTGSNRRLYSDEEIDRLTLLREITEGGHNIGAVAQLSTERLRALAGEVKHVAPVRASAGDVESNRAGRFLSECLQAVKELDSGKLEAALKRGNVELGSQGLLQRVIAPLAQSVGDLWRDGTISAAHEHFASAVIRIFLGHATQSFAGGANEPVIVIATPSGQIHELGALLAGAAAANLGWRVVYLGASLPAAEIAGSVLQSRARAIALSLVYPEDDPRLGNELMRLREHVGPGVPVLVGGRAMPAYERALKEVGAIPIRDLGHLCSTLENLRRMN